MPKRKRGRKEIDFQKLLDAMASLGLPPPTRLVATAICFNEGIDLSVLSWQTGLAKKVLQSHHFKVLVQYGFLNDENGTMRLQLPTDQGAVIPFRKSKSMEKRNDLSKQANQLIDRYRGLWARRYRKACVTNGHERTKALKLVGELGHEEALRRLEFYLEHEDPWIVERSHSFSIFYKLVNRYIRRQADGRKEEARGAGIIRHGSEDFAAEVRAFEQRERSAFDRRNAMEVGAGSCG